MKLPLPATDNISEVLLKIISFTEKRQKVLMSNINNIHEPGFMPQDLAVDEFSDVLNIAINEHIHNRRLMLCDTESVKFGIEGTLEITPVEDAEAMSVLGESRDRYLELQINRLMENQLNQKVASEMLCQKHQIDMRKIEI